MDVNKNFQKAKAEAQASLDAAKWCANATTMAATGISGYGHCHINHQYLF